MAHDADGSRNSDAKILAQLRRRSAASSARQESASSDAVPQKFENGTGSEPAVPTAGDRAETLKRLVSSNAPKEPMSALSSTIRGLREELGSAAIASYAAAETDAASEDASLDLIESELASRENASRAERAAAPEPRETKEPEPRVERVAPEPAAPSPRAQQENRPRVRDVNWSEVPDLLVVSKLRKGYVKGKKLIPVLQGVDVSVKKGELLAVVGQSGSGKSTLLHLMGTLDVPDSGTIHFDGQRIDNLPSAQRDVLRNRFIGMIFQFYHLIPEMTTLENVLAPLMIRCSIWEYLRERSKYVARAKELLELVGLSHRLRHRPNELSGGEMQRASIARALITNPRVLLADEPTGNLDSKASIGVLDLLRKLNEEQKLTIVMVTHDMSQAKDADRAIRLVDGMIVPE